MTMNTFMNTVLYFFFYSVLGWIWESIYCSIQARHFVYRGVLIGPYCPIYGFGILLALYIVKPIQGNLIQLFILSALGATTLEYLTGTLLEKLFKARWWSYYDIPLNYKGRIALPVTIFWGLGCVVIVKYVHPFTDKLVTIIDEKVGMLAPILIITIMLADTVRTVTNMLSFKKLMVKASVYIHQLREAEKSHIANRIKRLEEIRDAFAAKIQLKRFDKHLLNSYPSLIITGIKDINILKKLLPNKNNDKSDSSV